MMFLRDHQRVTEVDRTDVHECIHQVVLVDLAARNFTGDDFAENAVFHDMTPLC